MSDPLRHPSSLPAAPRQKHSAAANNGPESMLLEQGFTSQDAQAAGGRRQAAD